MQLNEIPLDLENLILEYKYGLEHYDKFRFCLNEIKIIKCDYKSFVEDGEIYTESTRYYKKKVSSYYICKFHDEIETSEKDSSTWQKYWLIANGKLEYKEN